ncbi:probable inactive leucine-rich repeat receptor-like protein kinase At3g03770 [Fagus crenata]
MPNGVVMVFLSNNSFLGEIPQQYGQLRFVSGDVKLGTTDLPVCRSSTFEELKEATKNFDNSAYMGEGSYGMVGFACKASSPTFGIPLGHCVDVGGRDDCSMNKVFLISEYVPSGSFHMYLAERLAVLISVAKAVHFLHTGIIPGFFHNRLKTNNILLNEHGMTKLSDYGLSIISEGTDKCGAKGEGLRSWQMKNLEDDVCSFGFILLEALVGPSVYARRDVLLLNEMASINSADGQKRIVDPIVQATCSQESLSIVISIMNKCISLESNSHPSIEDVLWNLQYAAQIQATVNGDHRFDTASPQ